MKANDGAKGGSKEKEVASTEREDRAVDDSGDAGERKDDGAFASEAITMEESRKVCCFSGNPTEIYVQFIPDNPYARTKFGALLKSDDGEHSLTALDGTGLARAIGFEEGDIILSINNVETSLEKKSRQVAVLESLADIGTKIALVIERKRKRSTTHWLFAFHLNEKEGKPIATNIFKHKLENVWLSFPVIPEKSAFPLVPVYTFIRSAQLRLILDTNNRFMRINTEIADYVLTDFVLTACFYDQIDGEPCDEGRPIALAASVKRGHRIRHESAEINEDSKSDCEGDDDEMMCIAGHERSGKGFLSVEVFPPYMTQPRTQIPANAMFFSLLLNPNGTANILAPFGEGWYLSFSTVGNEWIATLKPGDKAAAFKIEYQGRILTSLKQLFH